MSGLSQIARVGLAVAALMVLSGCIAYYDRNTERNFNSSDLPPGEGIVFVSLASEKAKTTFSYFSIRFRNTDTAGVGVFSYANSLLTGGNQNLDWNNANSKGLVRALTLPAGNYEIFRYSIFYGKITWETREDFSIPFRVVPGRATYLGEIKLKAVRGRNIFGIPGPAGGVLEISSNPARDTSLFRKKYPNISPDLIQRRPMRSGNVPTELITFR